MIGSFLRAMWLATLHGLLLLLFGPFEALQKLLHTLGAAVDQVAVELWWQLGRVVRYRQAQRNVTRFDDDMDLDDVEPGADEPKPKPKPN